MRGETYSTVPGLPSRVTVTLGDWLNTGEATALLATLALATLCTTALFLLSVGAVRRRRSRPYAFVAAAIGLLVVRSVVGVGTVLGVVPMPTHHLVGSGTDLLIATFVLAAVVCAGDGVTA